ncbi:hypothetical protein [Oscillatoria sp. FACHB-1407]|uniref:hypothetical protein n=1 Tax=Oscillatoria sp. FACHB-1407 TaxID=2692847 RepID=UPI0030DBAA41
MSRIPLTIQRPLEVLAIALERNNYVSVWDIPTQQMLGRFPHIRGHYSECRFETHFLSQDRTKLAGLGELGKFLSGM